MRRDPYLKLVSLSTDNHKNLKRRGFLPHEGETFGDQQGWTEYSLNDAISTVLMIDLAKVGVDQGTASNLVLRNDTAIFQAVKQAVKNDAEGGPDIWLAAIRFYYQDGEMTVERNAVVAAPLNDLYKAETKFGLTVSEIERRSTSIAMTNVSHAIREIGRRARQNEIEVDFKSIHVPEWFMPDGTKA